jgi:hypothetical protein
MKALLAQAIARPEELQPAAPKDWDGRERNRIAGDETPPDVGVGEEFFDDGILLLPEPEPLAREGDLRESLAEKLEDILTAEGGDRGSATRRPAGRPDVLAKLTAVLFQVFQSGLEMRGVLALAGSHSSQMAEDEALQGADFERKAAHAQYRSSKVQAETGIASGGIDIGGALGSAVLAATPLRNFSQPVQQMAGGVSRIVKEGGNLVAAGSTLEASLFQADAHVCQAKSNSASVAAQRNDAAVQNIDGVLAQCHSLLGKIAEIEYSTVKGISDHI